MKEDKLKALIKKGKLETSPDFTNQLLQKIALQQSQKKVSVWPFRTVFGIIVFLIGGLSYFLITDSDLFIHISAVSLKNLKMPFLFILFVFLFFGLNHVIRMHEIYKTKEKDIALP